MESSPANEVLIRAALLEKKELRYTPAGIAVFEATFHHNAKVYEAGAQRQVQFSFTALAFADAALRLEDIELGQELEMKGFLATRSLRSSKLTVHVTEFKIIRS